MNATLQCLSNTLELNNFLSEEQKQKENDDKVEQKYKKKLTQKSGSISIGGMGYIA